MRMRFVFPLVAVFAVTALIIFSYIGEIFLGAIIATVIFAWPIVFFLVTRFIENRGSEPKEDRKDLKPDIIEAENIETTKEIKEEEFVVPPKKDANIASAKE
jgi:hypothetical protein